LAVGLGVERFAETQRHSSKGKKLTPERAREHWITVAHDGTREPVEAHNVVEEGLNDGDSGVGVGKGDEVRVLGEAVDDGEHHGLAPDARKSLDEVHGDVRPYRTWNLQRLQ
jgi:hypothetical protein